MPAEVRVSSVVLQAEAYIQGIRIGTGCQIAPEGGAGLQVSTDS